MFLNFSPLFFNGGVSLTPYRERKGAIAGYKIPIDGKEPLILGREEIGDASLLTIYKRRAKLYRSYEDIPESIKDKRKIREIPEGTERIEIKARSYRGWIDYMVNFW